MNKLLNILLRFCLRHCYPTKTTTLFIITYLTDVYSDKELRALYRYWSPNKGDYAEIFCTDPYKKYYTMK